MKNTAAYDIGPGKHTWAFKRNLRANAYGWSSSALARKRLGEAVREIRAVARRNPELAGEGAVSLCERIWPAFQNVDTSSGALGSAVWKVIHPGPVVNRTEFLGPDLLVVYLDVHG